MVQVKLTLLIYTKILEIEPGSIQFNNKTISDFDTVP